MTLTPLSLTLKFLINFIFFVYSFIFVTFFNSLRPLFTTIILINVNFFFQLFYSSSKNADCSAEESDDSPRFRRTKHSFLSEWMATGPLVQSSFYLAPGTGAFSVTHNLCSFIISWILFGFFLLVVLRHLSVSNVTDFLKDKPLANCNKKKKGNLSHFFFRTYFRWLFQNN